MHYVIHHIYKSTLRVALLVFVSFLYAQTALAQTTYTPLQPLPGVDGNADFGTYLNALFVIGIAAAGVLAVMMIMYGGVKYMTVEAFSAKSDAKKIVWGAVLGLLLAFASWIILYTINPQILNLEIDPSVIDTSGEEDGDPEGTKPYEEALNELIQELSNEIGVDVQNLPWQENTEDEFMVFPFMPVDDWDPDDPAIVDQMDRLMELCKKWGFNTTTSETRAWRTRDATSPFGFFLFEWFDVGPGYRPWWWPVNPTEGDWVTLQCSRGESNTDFLDKADDLRKELILNDLNSLVADQANPGRKEVDLIIRNTEDNTVENITNLMQACESVGFSAEEIGAEDAGYDVENLEGVSTDTIVIRCS